MIRVLLYLVALVFAAPCIADDKVSLVLVDTRLGELVRVAFGELSQEPFVVSHDLLESKDLFTVDLRQVPRAQALSTVGELVRSAGFDVVKRGGVVWIGKAVESEDEIIVYRPRYRSSRYLADVVQSVTAARSILARSVKSGEVVQAVASKDLQAAPAPRQSSVTSVDGQVDRSEVDQIAFTVGGKDVRKVRKLLADLDTPSGEVVLKAAVYEVGFDKREGSAVQVVASMLSGKLLASASGGISGLVSNLVGGVSLKIVTGGLEAVLSALDADVRFKSVSRPQVRVRNGAQARFSVGQDVPVLGAAQVDRNGNPVQSVEYRQSGVILTATPEIRDDVIDLAIHQELSNFVVTRTGVNDSPTLNKRSVNTKLGMVPGEVVMLAGLQDDSEDGSDNRIPWLGWIIGKDRREKRSEILVFLEVIRI